MNWFENIVNRLREDGGLTNQHFAIANAEKLRNENPRSFSIPRSEQRKSLKVGDQAKILIEAKGSPKPVSGERPWVIVRVSGILCKRVCC